MAFNPTAPLSSLVVKHWAGMRYFGAASRQVVHLAGLTPLERAGLARDIAVAMIQEAASRGVPLNAPRDSINQGQWLWVELSAHILAAYMSRARLLPDPDPEHNDPEPDPAAAISGRVATFTDILYDKFVEEG